MHTYEYDYMQKLVGEGRIQEAKLLAKTFRFQDDCIAFNDHGAFRDHYPPEMLLENTNISAAVCNFFGPTHFSVS